MDKAVKSLKSYEIKQKIEDIKDQRKQFKMMATTDPEAFQKKMEERHPDFSQDYPGIFDKVCKGMLHTNMFNYMLQMLEKMEGEDVSEHSASVNVGEMLVNKYVKPLMKKADKK